MVLITTLNEIQRNATEKLQRIYSNSEFEKGAVLALDPGDGKTLTWLNFGLSIATKKPKMLIISELSPIKDWMSECEKHFSPKLSSIAVGNATNGLCDVNTLYWFLLQQYDVVIVNYDTLVQSHLHVMKTRVKLLTDFISKLDATHPSSANTSAFTPEQKVVHDKARVRREVLSEFLRQQAARPNITIPIPDAEMAKKERVVSCTEFRLILFYHTWDSIAFDEADKARSPGTNFYLACTQLKANFFCAITGTPFNNKIGDLQSMFEIVRVTPDGTRSWQEVYKNIDEYCSIFTEKRNDYLILSTDRANNHTKYQACEIYLHCDFVHPIERVIYDHIARMAGHTSQQNILNGITKLRQACNGIYDKDLYDNAPMFEKHIAQLGENKIELSATMPTKIQMLLASISVIAARKEKAIVYTAYKMSIHQMVKHINKTYPHIPVYVATGETHIDERSRIRQTFSTRPGCAILLTVDIFDKGVNIKAANHVIHYDNWWNPVKKAQRTCRVARIDQTKSIFVWNFVISNSVEESIFAVSHMKNRYSSVALTEVITPTIMNQITSDTALNSVSEEILFTPAVKLSDMLEGNTIVNTLKQISNVYINTLQDVSLFENIPQTLTLSNITTPLLPTPSSSSPSSSSSSSFEPKSKFVLKRTPHHLDMSTQDKALFYRSPIALVTKPKMLVLDCESSFKKPRRN